MKALLSSLSTVETIAPAAGTARTEASMHAESAAGAKTPNRLSLGLSFDITSYTVDCPREPSSRRKCRARDRNRSAIRFARNLTVECAIGAVELRMRGLRLLKRQVVDVMSELRAGLASLLTNTRLVGTCCEYLVCRDVHHVLPLTQACDGKRKKATLITTHRCLF
ncbi:unnamed protein product [Arctia plantaginis]|uniref:Uncharacterized protein n=1 Tax=Arctia plantaginis TaxID=874455 RepID=A0A8S1BK46_ARCPL|nr:unnamed protein product [Arctia plantaginis]